MKGLAEVKNNKSGKNGSISDTETEGIMTKFE
jgi:hypothetical protein